MLLRAFELAGLQNKEIADEIVLAIGKAPV